ncbi:MAG: DUF3301 domain-containing protein [Gammaproteobacteria bacterium]|jgi:hypothetical protein
MYTDALLLIAIVAAGLLVWFEAQRMREYVIRRCTAVCEGAGLQLLDETVALAALRLKRDRRGRLRLHRRYQFDVSETGTDRWRGWISLTGLVVEHIHIEGAEGATILEDNRRLLH